MDIQENVAIGRKTTMRIGGEARWYAEPTTKEEVEEAVSFAKEHDVPLIVLGGGSNTIFDDGVINALVIRLKADSITVHDQTVTAMGGKNLAMLINELAAQGLDLSALTGIPGTVGGAIFGNAGQGPKGIWIDSFVESVEAYVDGTWQIFSKEECNFRYRESGFKDKDTTPIIWSATLNVPKDDPDTIKANIEALLQRRIETQPHIKTAGSCFKAMPDGTPAWKLINAAGLRGLRIGGVEVSEKHANFLLNVGDATMQNVHDIVAKINESVPDIDDVEMRLYDTNGKLMKA